MVFAQNFILFAVLLQNASGIVEFLSSKLYDETDFAVPVLTIPTCGGRIYASVPVASAEIAKNLIVHDYTHDEISIFDVSKLTNGNEKGYIHFQNDIQQVKIRNMNPGNCTAPIAVWVVTGYDGDQGDRKVFEAVNLNIAATLLDTITLMSAEPYTLQSKTTGPMRVVAFMAGYDEGDNGRGDDDKCTNVIYQMDPISLSNIQARVQSPLLTIVYDSQDYEHTMTSIIADVGTEKSLDFSGISFAASPGYLGCQLKGQQTYRSSLYDSTTSFNVAITPFLNTDNAHPVTVNDSTNKKAYTWSGTTPENTNSQNITLQQTKNLEITWTRNENDFDQSFLIRLTP